MGILSSLIMFGAFNFELLFAAISNQTRPQVVDSGTAPRYWCKVITLATLADQLAIAVEDEAEQAGGAAVLLIYLLNPVKELSGKLRNLNNLHPCCSEGSLGG